jgi:hypothetical protein
MHQQYRLIAAEMMNPRRAEAAIAIYHTICASDPASHEDQLVWHRCKRVIDWNKYIMKRPEKAEDVKWWFPR